jgi:peptide/nickel transport system substrate-binding protein
MRVKRSIHATVLLAMALGLGAGCERQASTGQAGGGQKPEGMDAAQAAAGSATRLSADEINGITRVKTPEGGLLVTASRVPRTLRDPHDKPDFALGDWYVSNLGSEPSVITPYLDKDAYGNEVQLPVLESLLTRDQETFEWQPWLAESYEQKPDGRTIVYKLRKEAVFSDGKPVTADDVVFSFATVLDPKIDCGRYKSGTDRVATCTKIDERTVEFVFKEKFFQELEVSGGLGIIPKHVYQYTNPDEFNKRIDALVGSGPYIFQKEMWKRGQQIVLTRNEKYWGPKPPFDRLVYVFIKNPSAAFQSFQNGDIDSFGPDPEQYNKYANDESFKSKYTIHKYDRPNAGYGYIGWNEKKPMFADVKTRTALTMLVDRETLIATQLYGLGRAISGPFSYMTPQSDPTIKPLAFDPRAARGLLTEAGWKLNEQNVLVRNGQQFRFDLMIPSDYPLYQRVCEFMKNQFAKAGIIMTIAPFEFSVMVDRLDTRNFDAAMLAWTGGVEEDPFQIWHSSNIENKGSNFISWSNAEVDKLIDAGRQELDEAKRMAIWHKLHKVIADEQPYTFLWTTSSRVFIQPRFKNTQPYKLGVNVYDWYVPAGQQKYK